jgi:hypothetical protein
MPNNSENESIKAFDFPERVASYDADMDLNFLKPEGWFLNADLIVAADQHMEARIQKIRVEGIVRRAAGRDSRFTDAASTRRFLDDLEARDQDKPLTLSEDLRVLREAGLENASVFWVEYREAVTGGFR